MHGWRLARGFGMALLIVAAAACGDDEDGCVDDIAPSCAPLYEPTFENVFNNTLKPGCGVAGNSCHSSDGARAGLVFDNADDSYASLLGQAGATARVIPGDASCSVMMQRIRAEDPTQLMPPGKALSEAEACSVAQWIANGANR